VLRVGTLNNDSLSYIVVLVTSWREINL
jgi:hypothetical protein